jgi:hypothetical protein
MSKTLSKVAFQFAHYMTALGHISIYQDSEMGETVRQLLQIAAID